MFSRYEEEFYKISDVRNYLHEKNIDEANTFLS